MKAFSTLLPGDFFKSKVWRKKAIPIAIGAIGTFALFLLGTCGFGWGLGFRVVVLKAFSNLRVFEDSGFAGSGYFVFLYICWWSGFRLFGGC